MIQIRQRIAIAQKMGLRAEGPDETGLWSLTDGQRVYGYRTGISEEHIWKVACPPFDTCLNAIAEARRVLLVTDKLKAQFTIEMSRLFRDRPERFPFMHRYDLLNSTAPEQFEALVRSLGIWETTTKETP